MADGSDGTGGGAAEPTPVSVHFVNNVLAAAASLIEEEPDAARQVLADLGAFLGHRLRGRSSAPLREELDHVDVYLRLEEARFPGRLVTEPAPAEAPGAQCAPGAAQAPIGEAVGRWLSGRTGRVRVAMRLRMDGGVLEAQLDDPDDPAAAGERVRIPLLGQPAAAGGVT